MDKAYIIISVLFVPIILIGLRLAIIQFITASKELKRLKNKTTF